MAFELLANIAASITELQKKPMSVIRKGSGEAVAILRRNKPAFYAVPPALYEAMLNVVDDAHLVELARTRRDEPTMRVDIDKLIAEEK